MADQGTAVVVGVGAEAGLGAALCRRFAREGLHVFAGGRTEADVAGVAQTIRAAGGAATGVATDTTVEGDVLRLFDCAEAEGRLQCVVYNAGNNRFADFREMSATFFEEVWRVACLGGFLVGREAARRMAPHGHGSVL